ncbi:FMN-binding negative transcriptional regulator [Salinicola endophyticus]|uniref:FMN-binding negative transcriptional regulator n=1 Tax=Salinicola endophyticus TaxID=1949083 RepID=A0ABY8FH73_9GAMM|nr:FMN-binding negative transcriptional regulator [Salinicola endophyticus]WFF42155.1 FMN-binding negative transcriptional regulator [Salinicola endophyticus]
MHRPAPFRLEDGDALAQAMARAPFATLITQDADGWLADHLPLLRECEGAPLGVLRGHIARANPLVAGATTRPALAIFHGPQAYITPSWYPAKQEHGRVVPTWNYQVVHAHGTLRLIDDPGWLRQVVAALSERFERDRHTPWSIDDAPEAYIDGMCRGIVGIELRIERLEGQRKASQHKPYAERAAIQRGLVEERGLDEATARCLSGMEESDERH